MLYCGMAKCDITPDVGGGIPGYFEVRLNKGCLDRLYAKAVVFEADGRTCALVVCDTIQLERTDVLDIRRKAQELCGIPHENIFAWATHTHTGGPIDGMFYMKREKSYVNHLTTQAAQAIKDAYDSRRPAKIGSATGRVENTAFIRRFFMKDGRVTTNPPARDPDIVKTEGEPEDNYTVARIDDAVTGRVMGFLSSFGLHLDTVGGELVSADYPGALAEKVRREYGEEVMSIFFTGLCGNTNHFDMNDDSTRDGQTIRFKIAEKLFDELKRLDGEIVTADTGFKAQAKRFLVPLRKVSREQVDWARGVMDGSIRQESSKMFQPELFAKPILAIDERIEETAEIEISAVDIGDLRIIGWPGEMFVEFGRDLRSACPGRNMIIGELANGSLYCYIATPRAYENGGYEPCASGPRCCNPDCGDRIVHETLKLLGEMCV